MTAPASRPEIEAVVFEALENLNAELPPDGQVAINAGTPLFGPDATLDSLSLVSVIVDVETALTLAYEREVSLTDDRAMTREVSPFTDVSALVDYILELLAEPA